MMNAVQYIWNNRNATHKYTTDMNNDVISRLKFIGKVKKGEKINVKHMFVQPDNITTKISRMIYNQDNRTNTLSFLSNTINRAFQILELFLKGEDTSQMIKIKNIITDLKNSVNGILNLKHTYCDDIMFCCTLDTITEDIESKLLEFQNKYIKNKKKVNVNT